MSTGPHHVFVHFETDAGVPLEAWEAFCREFGLQHRPQVAGRNVWRTDGHMGCEATFGNGARGSAAKPDSGPPEQAEHVMLTTAWGGPAVDKMGEIARAFWIRFGGAMFADEDARRAICKT